MAIPLGESFADVEESEIGFDLLPKGTYTVMLTDHEIRESGDDAKHPGWDYISWEFTIQDEEHEGRKLWYVTSLYADWEEDPEGSKKTMGMLKGFLKVMGVEEDEYNSADYELEPEDLHERYIKVKVGVRKSSEYGDRNNITKFIPLDEDEIDELP